MHLKLHYRLLSQFEMQFSYKFHRSCPARWQPRTTRCGVCADNWGVHFHTSLIPSSLSVGALSVLPRGRPRDFQIQCHGTTRRDWHWRGVGEGESKRERGLSNCVTALIILWLCWRRVHNGNVCCSLFILDSPASTKTHQTDEPSDCLGEYYPVAYSLRVAFRGRLRLLPTLAIHSYIQSVGGAPIWLPLCLRCN